MVITRKKILTPEPYLIALNEGDSFYVAAQVGPDDIAKLSAYGLTSSNSAWIPSPVGIATSMNAEGKWIRRKDLPMELRAYERAYHVIDWHGEHHYGTCWQYRMCYQRELIPPTDLAFTLEGETLYSPVLHKVEAEMPTIKLAINVLLEMLGQCTILTADKLPAQLPVKQRSVPWEILRSGTRNEEEWREYIEKIVERRPKRQRNIIRQRHEFLWECKPDFCVLGKENFWGYVVYGFEALGLHIFECNKADNATYIFKGDWEAASQLTKTEILNSRLQEARLYHTESWKAKVEALVSSTEAEKI